VKSHGPLAKVGCSDCLRRFSCAVSIELHRIPHERCRGLLQGRLQGFAVGHAGRLQCGYQVVESLNLGVHELQAGELRTGFVGEGVEVVVDGW